MYNVYASETLGSFIFFLIILAKGEPMMIAIGLLIGILIAQVSSQAHLNPAVTAMMLMQGNVSNTEAAFYVCSQLLGAVLAVYWFRYIKK